VAEVEVDCITGERQVMGVWISVDAGRTVNPAVDMGQVEGAFLQGLGHVLTEEVVEDEGSGRNITTSTWDYKPPGLAELPKEFHVSLLRDSPLHVPKLSAKATGEPPMLLSAAVLCALQDAVGAAWRTTTTAQQDQHQHQQQETEGEDKHEGPTTQVKQNGVNSTQSSGCSSSGYAGIRQGSSDGGGEVAVAAVVNVPATAAALKEVLPPVGMFRFLK